jgi:opacity protein-like surface antigen
MLAGAASAQTISLSEGDPATYDWTGVYAKGGLSIGFPNEPANNFKPKPGAAVAFGGGYRFNPWIAAELDMNVTAGSDLRGVKDDLLIFAFTMNLKTYPLADTGDDLLPAWVQPYILFGFGGGVVDADDAGDESSFMMRFNLGSEFMVWDNIGLFFDTGYMVIENGDSQLDGTGQMVVGALYRF